MVLVRGLLSGGSSYLLGLLAKIKCSICSYRLDFRYEVNDLFEIKPIFVPARWLDWACPLGLRTSDPGLHYLQASLGSAHNTKQMNIHWVTHE